MNFHVQGDTELVAQLGILGGAELMDALRDCGEWVSEDAFAAAPVDRGELKNSIRIRLQPNYVDIVAEADHARYVEYGTGLFTTKQTFAKHIPWNYQDRDGHWHRTSGQHPQPFLIPALENNRRRILERLKKLIGGSHA